MPDTIQTALRQVIEGLSQPALVLGPDGAERGRNASLTALAGGGDWKDAVHAEDREPLRRRLAAGLAGGRPFSGEARLCRADGEEAWFRIDAAPLPEAAWLVTLTDIHAAKAAEEHRTALAREANHRVKNLFAMVNGLVSMTARSAATPTEMADTLRGRIGALSRAHELIRPAGEGAGALLEGLVRSILSPYGADGERVSVGGPPVPVGSASAANFALVLHELAVNAATYGALSAAQGRLSVAWIAEGEGVRLTWAESGGPELAGPPAAEGFGTRLARRTVTGQLGGEMAHDWRSSGLVLTLTLSRERLAR